MNLTHSSLHRLVPISPGPAFNRIARTLAIVVLALALLPTGRIAAQDPAGGECLTGEWVVADIGDYIEESFDGMLGVRSIEFAGATGEFRFTFSQDGSVAIEAEEYTVTVVAKVRFVGDVETAVTFDGPITGRFDVEGDRLTLTGMRNDDFDIEAQTPFGSFDAGGDEFFSDGENRIACGTGELQLWPGGEDGPAIRLVRPSPATPSATATV